MHSFSVFSSLSPWKKLFLYFALVLCFTGIGMLLLSAAIVFIYQVPLTEIETFFSDYSNPRSIEAMKWLNNLSQVFMFVIPAVVFIRLCGRDSVSGLMLNNPGWQIIVVPFWIIASSGLIDLSSQVNERMIPVGGWLEGILKPLEDQSNALVSQMLLDSYGVQFLVTLLTIGVIPALCEELAFRGVLQPLLARLTKNIHWGIWITAIVFSAIHLQFYSFIPRVLLGAMLGYLVVWTGSIWSAVFAHLINNCLALILFRMYGNTLEAPENPDMGWVELISSYALSLVTFALLTQILVKYSLWKWYRSEYMDIRKVEPEAPPDISGKG